MLAAREKGHVSVSPAHGTQPTRCLLRAPPPNCPGLRSQAVVRALGPRPAPRKGWGGGCEFQPPGPLSPWRRRPSVPRRDSCSQLLWPSSLQGKEWGPKPVPPGQGSCPAPTGKAIHPPPPPKPCKPRPRHFGLNPGCPSTSWAPLGPRGRAPEKRGQAGPGMRNNRRGSWVSRGPRQLTKQGLLESAAAAAVPRQSG